MTAIAGIVSSPAAASAGSAPQGAVAASAAGGTSPLNQLDNTQTFLQLLVAQLENQNPTSPTNPTSFMTEISQLAGVESQTSLSSEEEVVAADTMLGKQVTGRGTGGVVSGVVSGVLLGSSGTPELTLGNSGTRLALSAVTKVEQAAAPGIENTTTSTAKNPTTSASVS
ncbi:MAG: hypothetical protein M0Z82_09790 [Actinomycetota bacterium]|jgi:flagellar basal-body rod modification protein FlgD|nr:hypothetical protein [Actinomycetota bacterium]